MGRNRIAKWYKLPILILKWLALFMVMMYERRTEQIIFFRVNDHGNAVERLDVDDNNQDLIDNCYFRLVVNIQLGCYADLSVLPITC